METLFTKIDDMNCTLYELFFGDDEFNSVNKTQAALFYFSVVRKK